MSSTEKTKITVEATVKAPVEKVWKYWIEPSHITQWNAASEDWHSPKAENDVKVNGKFSITMAAKDGSMSFDFAGVYTNVQENKLIEYAMADDRKVKITFSGNGNETKVIETFEAEGTHSVEMQQAGWQAILDNFKKYTEAN